MTEHPVSFAICASGISARFTSWSLYESTAPDRCDVSESTTTSRASYDSTASRNAGTSSGSESASGTPSRWNVNGFTKAMSAPAATSLRLRTPPSESFSRHPKDESGFAALALALAARDRGSDPHRPGPLPGTAVADKQRQLARRHIAAEQPLRVTHLDRAEVNRNELAAAHDSRPSERSRSSAAKSGRLRFTPATLS